MDPRRAWSLSRSTSTIYWFSVLQVSTICSLPFSIQQLFLDNSFGRYELPLTGSLQLRVILSGIAAGLSRAILETPTDFWKIRRQVMKEWNIWEVTGLRVTTLSRIILLLAFFIYLEKSRPYQSSLFGESPIGTFLFTGFCATAASWTIWPLEYMKSQVQAGYRDSNQTLRQRMSVTMKEFWLSIEDLDQEVLDVSLQMVLA